MGDPSQVDHDSKQTEEDLKTVPLWINDKTTQSHAAITFPVYSERKQRNVCMAQSADDFQAREACDAAMQAFAGWKKTSIAFRRELLLKAADAFESHRSEVVALQVEETSCEESWAHFNLNYAIINMREIAGSIASLFGEMPRVASEDNVAMVFKEPVGPSLLIAPWNAAVVLAIRGIASMLAAGCTVVFKASEQCPQTHHLLGTVLAEVGLPNGVLNIIQCRRSDAPAVTESLIAHNAIRKVEFIGSPNVGRVIGQLAGKYLKPVLMELGGKCPAIVLDDADLEDAAAKCVRGAFMHHGQICFSTERIIVLESVADRFIPLLKKAAKGFAPGSGVSQDMVSKAYAGLVEARDKGATFLLGGPEYVQPAQLRPTIVTGVTEDMTLFDTESFGPSVSLYTAKDEEEAIKIANHSSYGLNASVHSSDMYRAFRVAQRLEVGQVHVNSLTTYNEATFPIGGTKGSGWGRNNSRFGIEQFVQLKTVSFNMRNTKINFGSSV